MILLRRMPEPHTVQWTWQPLTVAGSSLYWHTDGWSWLAGVLILVLVAATLLLDEDDQGGFRAYDRAARTLALGAAAIAFVFSGNILTLAGCWVLLDAALAFRLQVDRDAEPGGRAWGLLSLSALGLLAVLLLLGEHGIGATLAGGPFTQLELSLLWLVALIRSGVYPLHFWQAGSGRPDTADRFALHLIGPTAGLWLLGQVQQVAGPTWMHRPEWAALGSFALLGTALAAWSAADEGLRWRWIAMNRACLAALATYLSESIGPETLVWSLATFSLGPALLAAGQVTQRRLRPGGSWRLPAWLGALATWGLPGTTGFLARAALILPTALPLAIPLFGIMLVAETLLAAALWQAAFQRPTGAPAPSAAPRLTPVVRLGAAVVLLAVPIVAWGLAPRQLVSLAGLAPLQGVPTLLWTLAHARRSVWAGLIFSGLAGVGLGLMRRQVFSQMRGWQQGIYGLVSLEWLYQAVTAALSLASSGLQFFATVGEGEGYLGWLALAGLILWVLLRG